MYGFLVIRSWDTYVRILKEKVIQQTCRNWCLPECGSFCLYHISLFKIKIFMSSFYYFFTVRDTGKLTDAIFRVYLKKAK